MAILGGLGFTWWLFAAASGPMAYANFQYYVWQAEAGDLLGLAANVISRIVLIGLSWAFFQHMLSGLRHLVMDMGAGYELQANKRWSMVILTSSIVLTVLFWAWIFAGRGL